MNVLLKNHFRAFIWREATFIYDADATENVPKKSRYLRICDHLIHTGSLPGRPEVYLPWGEYDAAGLTGN
jgi:hypothetical protein